MSEYKVGDKVRVTKLVAWDRTSGLQHYNIYKVTGVDDITGGVYVETPFGNRYGLIYDQIEKVEEEKQVNEFKVGDKVRVKWVDTQDVCRDISKGDCFDVLRVDSDGDVRVGLPNGGSCVLFKLQVELVEEEKQVSEFKVGDKVKVKYLETFGDNEHLNLQDEYVVSNIDDSKLPRIKLPNGDNHMMYANQIKKVENKTEFTFPEMAQKLIDGEFEIGTELVTNDDSTYFVDRTGNSLKYGLKTIKDGGFVTSNISASDFNATWKVKEQVIKEMSIEEIQKELGYKIKVTE